MSRSIRGCASEGELCGSSASNQEYASSERLKEAAKRAAIAATMALMKELHSLEDSEARFRQRREEMELRLQLEEAKAKEEVFESFCESEIDVTKAAHEESINENEHERAEISKNDYERSMKCQHAEAERSSIEMVRKMQLPALELQPFDGDPTQYNNFIRGFDAKIACRIEDDEERLYYLDQYTRGKPRDIVSTCLHMPPGTGYAEARRLLQERYGNVIQAVAHMIERIMAWPSIRPGTDDLDRFAIFLRGSWNALKSMPQGVNEIDAKTIRTILNKLSPSIKDRWCRMVDRIEHEELRSANFGDLVKLRRKRESA